MLWTATSYLVFQISTLRQSDVQVKEKRQVLKLKTTTDQRYLKLKEFRECDDGGGQADDNDDDASAPWSAPDFAAHWMTDADVTFDGERHRQPDGRVTACVAEPHCVRPAPVVPTTRRHVAVVTQDDDEDECEIADVVDGQRRQVVVRRRLHRPARQHGDVDRVGDDAEHDDDRHQNALDDEPRHRQLASQSRRRRHLSPGRHGRH